MIRQTRSTDELKGVFAVPPLARRHEAQRDIDFEQNDLRLERGYREFAEASRTKLIVYLKEENTFGSERDAGLDAVARLVQDGICVGIKYAVVRREPLNDPYLEGLLARVDRKFVLSGIGERPALLHLRDWKLPGFTTGSGCISP